MCRRWEPPNARGQRRYWWGTPGCKSYSCLTRQHHCERRTLALLSFRVSPLASLSAPLGNSKPAGRFHNRIERVQERLLTPTLIPQPAFMTSIEVASSMTSSRFTHDVKSPELPACPDLPMSATLGRPGTFLDQPATQIAGSVACALQGSNRKVQLFPHHGTASSSAASTRILRRDTPFAPPSPKRAKHTPLPPLNTALGVSQRGDPKRLATSVAKPAAQPLGIDPTPASGLVGSDDWLPPSGAASVASGVTHLSFRQMWPVLNPNAELGMFVSAVQDIRAYRAKRRLLFDRHERYLTRVPPRRILERLGHPASVPEACGNAAAVVLLLLGAMAMTASMISGAGLEPVIAINVVLVLLLTTIARRLLVSKRGRASVFLLSPVAAGVVSVAASLTTLTILCEEPSARRSVACGAVLPADNIGVQVGLAAVVEGVISRILSFLGSSPWAWAPYVAGVSLHLVVSALYIVREALRHRRAGVQSGGAESMATEVNPMHASAALASSTGAARTMAQRTQAQHATVQRATDSPEAPRSVSSFWSSTEHSFGELEQLVDDLNAIITRNATALDSGQRQYHSPPDLRKDQQCKMVLEGLLQLIQARADETTELNILRRQRDRAQTRQWRSQSTASTTSLATTAVSAAHAASQRDLLRESDVMRLRQAASTIVHSARAELRTWQGLDAADGRPGVPPAPPRRQSSLDVSVRTFPVDRDVPSLDSLGHGFGESIRACPAGTSGMQPLPGTGLEPNTDALLELDGPAMVPAAGWLARPGLRRAPKAVPAFRGDRPSSRAGTVSARALLSDTGRSSRRMSAGAPNSRRLGVLGALYAETGDWRDARAAHEAMNQLRSRRSIIAAGALLSPPTGDTSETRPLRFVQTPRTRRASMRDLPSTPLMLSPPGAVSSTSGATEATRSARAGVRALVPRDSSSLRHVGHSSRARRSLRRMGSTITECDELADDDGDKSSSSHRHGSVFAGDIDAASATSLSTDAGPDSSSEAGYRHPSHAEAFAARADSDPPGHARGMSESMDAGMKTESIDAGARTESMDAGARTESTDMRQRLGSASSSTWSTSDRQSAHGWQAGHEVDGSDWDELERSARRRSSTAWSSPPIAEAAAAQQDNDDDWE